MVQPVLRIEGVRKVFPGRFGKAPFEAVKDISFTVQPGEILGLLGPNGAGKSTTLKMIAGLLRPTDGKLWITDIDVARERSRAVRHLGAVLEGNRNLHWKLTAEENLSYFGALKGAKAPKHRADELLERLEMGPHRKKRVGELSRGLQQRVAIAVALMVEPQVLLLDEPTLGLDVLSAATFKDVIRHIADQGCAIVLTTHQMEVAQELSDRLAIIAGGQLVALDSMSALQAAYRSPGYALTIRGALEGADREALESLGAAPEAAASGFSAFRLPEGDPKGLYRAIARLEAAGAELVRVEQQDVNLEAIYRRVVEGAR